VIVAAQVAVHAALLAESAELTGQGVVT